MAGFYDNLLQGGELTGADLDGVSTSHPIFVLYVNGHVGAANRLAFDRAKIPPDVGTLPGGGHFGRGPDGQLDGRIYEQPALLTFTAVAMPAPTPAFLTQALTAYAKRAAAAGNTTLHEPGTVKPEWVEHLAALEAITASAARQIGLADALGTLEPGKEADLTILESDPCTADPEKIASIRVSETWVAGERKFG